MLGLKVGYVLGVLEGLYAAFGDGAADGDGSTQGEPDWKAERRMKMRAILAEARRELTVEKVFGKEWWGPDGIWTFDVEPDVEITFEQVAEMHPLLQVWTRRAREEMESLGIRQGMYEGEEWESGRAVEGEVDAS